jgi:hypothetical protein
MSNPRQLNIHYFKLHFRILENLKNFDDQKMIAPIKYVIVDSQGLVVCKRMDPMASNLNTFCTLHPRGLPIQPSHQPWHHSSQ